MIKKLPATTFNNVNADTFLVPFLTHFESNEIGLHISFRFGFIALCFFFVLALVSDFKYIFFLNVFFLLFLVLRVPFWYRSNFEICVGPPSPPKLGRPCTLM